MRSTKLRRIFDLLKRQRPRQGKAYNKVKAILFFFLTSSIAIPAHSAQTLLQITEHAYLIGGDGYEITRDNLGRIANIGVIVQGEEALVVNTGVSYKHGTSIIETVEKGLKKKILGAIVLEPGREYVFGASAFRDAGIPVASHPEAVDLISTRCNKCLVNLEENLGNEMLGTKLVIPSSYEDVNFKKIIDKFKINIVDTGSSAYPGAILLYADAAQVLFSGSIAMTDTVPDIKLAKTKIWISLLKNIPSDPMLKIIPNLGGIGDSSAIFSTMEYLMRLNSVTEKLFEDNVGLIRGSHQSSLPDFEHYHLYDKRHFNNFMYRYLELENVELTN
jgi:hypothetical protein